MGYTLTIGEAEIDYNEDSVRICAANVTLDEAPAFGEPTDNTNTRWPSYAGWSDAMKKLGLTDFMFAGKRGGGDGAGSFEWNGKECSPLLIDHPGAELVTQAHLEYLEAKLAAYKAAHPDHVAAYPPLKPGIEKSFIDPRYDAALVRGEWLLFWMRWALKNCKQPVFTNS